MLDSSITERLASLPRLSKPAVCDLWRQLFKKEPPPEIRKDSMLRVRAHRLQEQSLVASATPAAAGFANSQLHSRPIPTQVFKVFSEG
jgi:hypothetical protein